MTGPNACSIDLYLKPFAASRSSHRAGTPTFDAVTAGANESRCRPRTQDTALRGVLCGTHRPRRRRPQSPE
eukprot:10080136-Lingulodinium_polyedra.AAC.1